MPLQVRGLVHSEGRDWFHLRLLSLYDVERGNQKTMAARAIAIPKKNQPQALPLEEQIRQRAYEIYVQRDGQDGSELDDWLHAEAELRSRGKE
jgi:hypothetical protein